MSAVLPDRERRHLLQFYLAPSLGYRTRLTIGAGLITLGLVIQLLWAAPDVALLLIFTLPIILVGNALLLAQGVNLKPTYSVTAGQWEKTTRDRFDEVRQLPNKIQTWDQAVADVTCGLGIASLVGIAVLVFIACSTLATSDNASYWAPVFAADALALLIPHWISGTRRGWKPVALREQVVALDKALRAIDHYEDPPCQIQPMFEVAGDDVSKTPIGARVFVRFPDGREDFLGLQYQVSINDVQGTRYPYLYAVIVARTSFGLLGQPLEACRRRLPEPKKSPALLGIFTWGTKKKHLIVEAGREEDVEVIIIRQHTTKESGYHTESPMIAQLATVSWELASEFQAR